MVFKVSQNIKGSLILSSVGYPLQANSKVALSQKQMYSDDVRNAIKNKILIPQSDEPVKEIEEDPSVVVVNKLNRVLILGNITVPPMGSVLVDKINENLPFIKQAAKNKLISVVQDAYSENPIDFGVVEDIIEEVVQEDIEENSVEKNTTEEEPANIEPQSSPQVWDMRKQKLQEGDRTNKTSEAIEVKDEENVVEVKNEEDDFINELDSINDTQNNQEELETQKVSSKKTTKAIEPVGEKKETTNEAVPLDSNGNIITEKPSKVIEEMIEGFEHDDLDFVDKKDNINDLGF